ncbi:uncharacterized protein SPPG_08495 [Spizellomyces punctatus DAOM BR117]|uniref:Uncharacterized protein n=1 Tax=Spizellomyces punctatus (strain DAOM BR117) TaxID=645134 RepID=A0A0L0H5D5_SPIPD|nr:uncharacterized protein SPPG_08495 [Spizellomyces punctatus DAOM BR117]KNC96106.1 hypothetical protein SPPG_08495 [Spizellomyces punctatus DAOM BR117]|eukprot:XP_016604146.1 hypothetical protein SPPG_08495 [Spizellomyces punctatus DAOM BR117]
MAIRDTVQLGIHPRGRPLRILVATEYLPPYVSGIANRFKNLVKGYREEGHEVTVASVAGTACDLVVPSVPNFFYPAQRMFFFPPLLLLWQLCNPFRPVPYDIVHLVSPLCLPLVPLTPLFKLRGVKIYVSYHVYMEFYKKAYFYNKTWLHKLVGDVIEKIYTWIYFVPLVYLADLVGVPSRTADSVVYRFAKRIHFMKSGLDTKVFVPKEEGTMDGLLSGALVREVGKENGFRKSTGSRVKDVEEFLPPYSAEDEEVVEAAAIPSPSPSGSNGPILVYVGRLAPEKNVQFLIRALAHPTLQTASLVIVGDGPSRWQLEQLAQSTVGESHVYSNPPPASTRRDPYSALSLAPAMAASTAIHRVIFTGMVLSEREIAQYYAHADIFVSASASETFGFTVAEALACGTPAVVVRSGAFATVYKCINQWMFDEDEVTDFVDKVVTCFEQGVEARRMSRKLAVGMFGVRLAVGDLLGAYDKIVNGESEGTSQVCIQ